jgi:hypothetical protein
MVYDHRDSPDRIRLSIQHHLHALDRGDVPHDIYYYNSFEEPPDWLLQEPFDAVILHNTFLCFRWTGDFFYSWKEKFRWIADFKCPKIAIPQDEYDHAEVLDEWLYDWGVSIIFSNFDERHRKLLHPLMYDKADFYRCFTGYVDEDAAQRQRRQLIPYEERPLDMVYRARHLGYWFGRIGQSKHEIAEKTLPLMQAAGFTCDISTRAEDVIIGDAWLDFLTSSKTVLGSEGGSSVIDYRGEVKEKIQAILKREPALSFKEVDARLPPGWDGHKLLVVTPRHFEAVITKTAQVLMEGDYDGVLEADKHYIPVKSDFSNFDEVVQKIRDLKFVKEMIECAHRDIYLSGKYTYRSFAGEINRALEEHLTSHYRAQAIRRAGEPVSTRKVTDALERQMIAERHKNALLEARLEKGVTPEAQKQSMAPPDRTFLGGLMQQGIKYLRHRRLLGIAGATLALMIVANLVISIFTMILVMLMRTR